MNQDKPIRATVWNEYLHELEFKEVGAIYPEGIHGCIANALKEAGIDVKTATFAMPEHGLTQEVLNTTDVLFWWGHAANGRVDDEIVQRVYNRVMEGMGLIVLHSGHGSKIFQKLMGTQSGKLKWREDGEREILWTVNPSHPICAGLEEKIELPNEEMYGEHFNIATPDELVFVSWFEGGEIFRSGCCWHRGLGKIFYFRPGHEAFPVYHNAQIQKVLVNAARWACPEQLPQLTYGNTEPVVAFAGASNAVISNPGLHAKK